MIDSNVNGFCSGCGACSNICPVDAIEMLQDDFGFSYPHINDNTCIHCNKCSDVCLHYHQSDRGETLFGTPSSWIYASQDEKVKLRSSSGGAFYELARKVIENGGYVCGCIWNDKLVAEHIVSNEICDIQRMQGSKYVQSDIKDCYSRILLLLKKGKRVLFSGTPCQCNAIHRIVKNEIPKLREKIYIVGLICHGVSTPNVWESYKAWLEKKYGSSLKMVNFRDKSIKGYKKSYCKYEFESGKTIYLPTYLPSSKYIEATLVYNLSLRNSCSHCECKGITESCDIILGDWYKAYSGKGKLGTSCICAFTKHGEEFVKTSLYDLQVVTYGEIVKNNGLIENSTTESKRREQFLSEIDNNVWDRVEKYYPPKYKLKRILVKIGIYDVIKKIIK